MNEATAPPPSPSAALELRDFSDRLPAVLVKELRQGLRARLFVIPFLLLHGLLVLSSIEGTAGSTAFFWQCLIIMLTALLPMRNISALSEERQANTLDTLVLTRLTPWRIVWGKWSATMALVLLTAVSALPYLLVRYLNGGSSMVAEAAALAGLVLISGAFTAVLTSLSTLQAGLTRHIMAVLLIFAIYASVRGALAALLGGQTVPLPVAAALAVLTVWGALFFLWAAAAALAPAAENLTTPRRLTTLAALGLGILLVLLTPGRHDVAFASFVFIVMAASMVEMGDPDHRHPGVTAAFAKRGAAGALGAVFLHPGWATGVIFSLLLWLALLLLFSAEVPALAGFAAICFFPVCAGAPLLARARTGGTAVMLLLAALGHILAVLAQQLLPDAWGPVVSFLPHLGGGSYPREGALLWAGLAVLLALRPLAALSARISQERNL